MRRFCLSKALRVIHDLAPITFRQRQQNNDMISQFGFNHSKPLVLKMFTIPVVEK